MAMQALVHKRAAVQQAPRRAASSPVFLLLAILLATWLPASVRSLCNLDCSDCEDWSLTPLGGTATISFKPGVTSVDVQLVTISDPLGDSFVKVGIYNDETKQLVRTIADGVTCLALTTTVVPDGYCDTPLSVRVTCTNLLTVCNAQIYVEAYRDTVACADTAPEPEPEPAPEPEPEPASPLPEPASPAAGPTPEPLPPVPEPEPASPKPSPKPKSTPAPVSSIAPVPKSPPSGAGTSANSGTGVSAGRAAISGDAGLLVLIALCTIVSSTVAAAIGL